MMKTVRHAICGPIEWILCVSSEVIFLPAVEIVHTEVLDVDYARVTQAGGINRGIFGIGYHAAVTTLGDAKSVNGGAGNLCNAIVQSCT